MQDNTDIESLLQHYERAVAKRRLWENLWDDCYNYTFPSRHHFDAGRRSYKDSAADIFDATAPDAAEQLASGLLGELTPPFGKWLELQATPAYEAHYGGELQTALDEARDVFHEHLQRSNFLLEIQQAFLDSVIVGTSVLSFSENSDSDDSIFQFSALPLHQIYVCEGRDGRLSHVFRRSDYSLAELKAKFPQLDEAAMERLGYSENSAQANNGAHNRANGEEEKLSVIEAVTPSREEGYDYHAILQYDANSGRANLLRKGHYRYNPFIAFRWMKTPGEDYGRSPVMKLLPDIKTANKVVELILKNAAIAVTGIWQADDDGVLNPANIKLTPGTIIPKAVGSKGLTPLQPSADFNLSQVILEELRVQIRRGLLYDQLSPNFSPLSTATEILEKSARTSRLLGATYGRMQSELLLPLAHRGLHILKRRGLIAPLPIDGVNIRVRIQSPLARQQRLNQVQTALQFIDYAARLQSGFSGGDTSAMLSWLARQMEIPKNIIPNLNADIPSGALTSSPTALPPSSPTQNFTQRLENNHA